MPEGIQPGSYSVLQAGDDNLPASIKQLPVSHAFLAVAFGSDSEKEVQHAFFCKTGLLGCGLLIILTSDTCGPCSTAKV